MSASTRSRPRCSRSIPIPPRWRPLMLRDGRAHDRHDRILSAENQIADGRRAGHRRALRQSASRHDGGSRHACAESGARPPTSCSAMCMGSPAWWSIPTCGGCRCRLGLTRSREPEVIEQDLCAILPPSDWTSFSMRLILHGRQVCKARIAAMRLIARCFLIARKSGGRPRQTAGALANAGLLTQNSARWPTSYSQSIRAPPAPRFS